MATIDTAYYVPTFYGLCATFGISCAITVSCVATFEFFRSKKSMQCLFSPRTRLAGNKKNNAPPPLSYKPFGWLKGTYHLDEPYFITHVGLDATMYLRFLRMATQFLAVQTILTCPILLVLHWFASPSSPAAPSSSSSSYPNINHTNTITTTKAPIIIIDDLDFNNNNDNNPYTNFQSNATLYRLSISNVPHEASIMWVHVVLTWIISLSWLWLLFVNYWHHLLLLLQQPIVRRSRTVLLTNVPHHLRNAQTLRQHFSSEFGPVNHVCLLSQAGVAALHSALQRREQYIDRLERRLILWYRQQQQHHGISTTIVTTTKEGDDDDHDCLHASLLLPTQQQQQQHDGEGVSDMVHLIRKIDRLDAEIEQLREYNALSARYHIPTGTAFVTFKSIESAQICAKMSWKPGVFQTQIAPEPRDLLWNGLLRQGRRDKLMGRLRQWAVFIAVWSLTIFWLFPVSFILGLTSIESLSQHFGFLNYFMDTSDVVRSFIQNILPMLLVTLFMSLLPWILLVISKQQDFVSYSALEDAVLGRYYRFAIFNVLIVFLLGTSFLSTLLDVLYEPGKLIHLLGKFLPQGANFFLNYILFNLATHAMELVQLGSQLFGHFYHRLPCVSKTPRQLARHTRPWPFPFYYYYPNHILVFVIALTYSVIQPLILLFALFYFLIALQVFRHQFAYAYVRHYESNGQHYRRMAGYTSDGLVIFQLTMTGLLYLKGAIMAATAIVPLTLVTIWAKIKLAQQFSRRRPRIHLRPPPPSQKQHQSSSPVLSSTSSSSSTTTAATVTSIRQPSPRMDQEERLEKQEEEEQEHLEKEGVEDTDRQQPGKENNRRKNDDGNSIWKLAYIKAWYRHGRYAPQHFPTFSATTTATTKTTAYTKQERHQVTIAPPTSPTSSTSTDRRTLVMVVDDITSTSNCSNEQEEEEYATTTLTVYPDDMPREDERFDYPPLVTPLERRLWLPRDANRRCWDVNDCVSVSLDELRRSLDPPSI